MPHSDPDSARTPKEPPRPTAHRRDAAGLDAKPPRPKLAAVLGAADLDAEQRGAVDLAGLDAAGLDATVVPLPQGGYPLYEHLP